MFRQQCCSSVGDTDFPFAPDRAPLSLAQATPKTLTLVEQRVLTTLLDDRATAANGPGIVIGLIVLGIENLGWHPFAFGSLHPVKLVRFTHLLILAVFSCKCKKSHHPEAVGNLVCVDVTEGRVCPLQGLDVQPGLV